MTNYFSPGKGIYSSKWNWPCRACDKRHIGDENKFNKCKMRIANPGEDLTFEPTGADAYEWVCAKHALSTIIFRYALDDPDVKKEMLARYRATPRRYAVEWKEFFKQSLPSGGQESG